MKILLINVSLRPNSPLKIFPVGLGYIATALKNAGFKFEIFDIDAHRYTENDIKQFFKNNKFDVVCMGCIVTGYKIVKNLSLIIKEFSPKTTIIIGNSVATSIPDTLLTRTQADIAVIGEGDLTIVDLLNSINLGTPLENVKGIVFKKDKKIIKTQTRELIKDISTLSFIDYSLFDIQIYLDNSKEFAEGNLPIPKDKIRTLPVNTARGCVANCSFCYHVFKSVPYRHRSADSIITELKSLIKKFSLNYIIFSDELTFYSKKQTLEFVEKIINEDLRFYWMADCRAGLFTDDSDLEIINKMKQAGCIGVGYSLESSDPKILEAMNKHITLDQFSKQTKLFHKAGLPTWTGLVLGYPQETPETIKKTFDCCIENKIYPSVGYLLPQPGSVMYDYAVKNNFINDEEEYLLSMGDRQDLRLNMTSMSDEEFQTEVLKGIRLCNQKLNMGLKEENLIKTQFTYKVKRT